MKQFAAVLRSEPVDLIRSELFGLKRLEKDAESLAEAQPATRLSRAAGFERAVREGFEPSVPFWSTTL